MRALVGALLVLLAMRASAAPVSIGGDAALRPRIEPALLAAAVKVAGDAVIGADLQALGDGAAVHLVVRDADGKARGSTTVALSAQQLAADPVTLERPLRGGLLQVLDPARFVGRLELKIDVAGAQVEVDGRIVPSGVVALRVGTHAVRVTHRAYRDWVRFVDIEFDETRAEPVALAAFPLTEGEMAERRRLGGAPVARKLPWYRSAWVLGIGSVVLAGATAGIVFAARPGIPSDRTVHYMASPAP